MEKFLSDNEYEKLLRDYEYSFGKGDLVKGTVENTDKSGIFVDIGAKSAAFVPQKEISEDLKLKIGDTAEFLITDEDIEDGKFILSQKKVNFAKNRQILKDKKRADETVLGKIVSMVKGGVNVEVYGIRGFIPSSCFRSTKGQCKQGDDINLKILSIDETTGDVIFSNKEIYEEEIIKGFEKAVKNIKTGDIVEATIMRITDFGAFADIGGVDGLLPLSGISHKWVDHPSEVLSQGDVIKVKVINIDEKRHRISLSLKELEEIPKDEFAKIKEGDTVKGIITKIKPFGAFLQIFSSVEGLLPRAELDELQKKNGCVYNIGDELTLKAVSCNPEKGKIGLGADI